ncbi:cytochrome P450 [Artomyces pyxidatus]|uniref:Cytochrome P450 n=1 Tax=Artomyces pyxidatus TaxID=48021 RepID=A0ACB8SVG1_9AGAM|nr:cytochrome P450 [Artomyces pyxidatus]
MSSAIIFYPSSFLPLALVELSLLACFLAISRLVYYRMKQLPLRKIPGPPSTSFLTGNLLQLFDPSALPFYDKLSKTYGGVIKINAMLGDTQLLISDPKACTSILLKEQDTFEESPWFIENGRHAFGPCLFSTTGAHHRRQRKQLNPVFSIKNMRALIPIFQNVTHQLQDSMRTMLDKGAQEIDIVEWLGRLALELVAQGGLGHTFDSLDPTAHEHEFAGAIKEYIPTMSALYVWRELLPLVSYLPPKLLRFVATSLPWPTLHRLIDVLDTMHANAQKIFDKKMAILEKGSEAAESQVGEGKDIISTLLKANMAAPEDEKMTDDEIVAQMNILLLAGTDTTSSALCRVLHLLSQHQDVQDRLRKEIAAGQSRTDGAELDYDGLVGLPYLDAICRETLRLFPPVPVITRTSGYRPIFLTVKADCGSHCRCRSDICIPLLKPITTIGGDSLASLYIPGNTDVFVNILGLNRDTSIWGPDAAEWKPERWLQPLPESVEGARIPGIYANTLTFLGGGRACIGFKFSQLEMKVALSQLIQAFRFSLPKAEVTWRFGGILTPSIAGSSLIRPTMPLKVESIRP